jgi:hypothetical protein
MDKVLIDKSALEKALEAFVHMCHNTSATRGYNSQIVSDAMNTLRTALNQEQKG